MSESIVTIDPTTGRPLEEYSPISSEGLEKVLTDASAAVNDWADPRKG